MKKILIIPFLLCSLYSFSQSLYIPSNPDSIKVPVNVNGAVRTVYNIDLVKYRSALTARDTAAGLRALITGSVKNLYTQSPLVKVNDSTVGFTPAGATGDIYYRNGAGNFTSLPIGATGQHLKVVSGLPAWVDTTAAGSGGGAIALTQGSVGFGNGTTITQDNANFFWDNTNKRLGIGNAAPAYALEVNYANSAFGSGIALKNTSTSVNALAGVVIKNSSNTEVAAMQYLPTNYTNAAMQNTVVFASVGQQKLAFISNSSQAGGIAPASFGQDIYFSTHGSKTTYDMAIKGTTGSVGIGLNSPTAYLHIKAGAAAANAAPLKLTSGTNLTTAEAGAIEYNGTNFFATPSNGTRQSIIIGTVVTGTGGTNQFLQTTINGTVSYIPVYTTLPQ